MAHYYQKRWVFTWNSDDEGYLIEYLKLIRFLNEISKEGVFQKERGVGGSGKSTFVKYLRFGAPSPNSYYDSSTMCPYELEKAREEAENSKYSGYCGGNYDLPPVDHPSCNPPLWFPEQLPPE